jgi:hypothetical protein
LLSALLLVGSLSNEGDAQTTTSGGLSGVVTDPTHAVVPDADVEIKDQAKGKTASTKTDHEGAYQFFFLAPGRYTLTVTHGGFQEGKRAVNVLLGPTVSANVTLEIATATATVTVTEEAPVVQAENGDAANTVTYLQVSQLPNPGNDLTYIVQSTAGTIMNTDGGLGNFSLLGMPATTNLFTLNGMNDNDMGANVNEIGAANLLLGQNQIQEATVTTNGYSGQFGALGGADVNFITKSGNNKFHGNLAYFWNGRLLNANDWINKAFGNPRPFSIANQWAGSIGGPVSKDKVFFFLNAEGLRITLPNIFQVVAPSSEFEIATIANIDNRFGANSASDAFYKQIFSLYNNTEGKGRAEYGDFRDALGCGNFLKLGPGVPCAVHFITSRSRPTDESLFSGRVDWNARKTDEVFLLVQYDHGLQATVTDPINSLFNLDSNQPWWQGQIVETHTFGNSAANQFLVAGWWLSALFKPKDFAQTSRAFPTRLGWCDGGSCSFTDLGLSLGAPVGRNTTQWQISDDLIKTLNQHKLGVGIHFQRAAWSDYSYGFDTAGTLKPLTLDAFYEGGVDPNRPDTDLTQLTQSFTQGRSQRISFYNLGLYANDEWRIRTNLSLTFGLRIEHQSNPLCRNRCFARLAGPFESVVHDPNQPYNEAILVNQRQALQNLNGVLWSPRFSFAWQPLGLSHNTVIRGGMGIFFSPLPGNLTDFFSTNPPLSNGFIVAANNIAPEETSSLFRDAANSNAAFLNAFSTGKDLTEIQNEVAGFTPPALTSADRKFRSPQYQKWSLELQHAFGVKTSLTIGYFGNHGIHELIQNRSANAFGFASLPAAPCTSPPVPPCADPRFSQVTHLTTAGISNYNGLVVSVKHQFGGTSPGLFQASYSYGHALDEVSNGGLGLFIGALGGSPITPQNPADFREAYGPADYDVRHSFNANYVWEIPIKMFLRNRGSDLLTKGWHVSGTIFTHGGFPYTVYDDFESALLTSQNFGGELYAVPSGPLGPALPCGSGAAVPSARKPCQPAQVLSDGGSNPSARFIQAGCTKGFNVGNLPGASDRCGGPSVNFVQGRNRFRAPSYFGADLAVIKNTTLPGWEKGKLGIGFQLFNVFNHPNFGLPDGFTNSPTFGQVVYTASPPTGILGAGFLGTLSSGMSARVIQVKAQLLF